MLFFLAEEVGAALYLPVTLAFAFLSLEGLKSDKNLLLSSSLACRLFRTLCFFFRFFFSSRDRSWNRKIQILFSLLHFSTTSIPGSDWERSVICVVFRPDLLTKSAILIVWVVQIWKVSVTGDGMIYFHKFTLCRELRCWWWLPLEKMFYVVFIQMFLKLQIKAATL